MVSDTPPRENDFPGRSRSPRTLLDDIQGSGKRGGRDIRQEGEIPPDFSNRLENKPDTRPVAQLYSCPTCPATHSAEMMLAVDDLAGNGLPDQEDAPYICCWCDQHSRRIGKIDRTRP